MKKSAILLLGLMLLFVNSEAISKKPSMSQHNLDKRWQQYISNPGNMKGAQSFPYMECFSQSFPVLLFGVDQRVAAISGRCWIITRGTFTRP